MFVGGYRIRNAKQINTKEIVGKINQEFDQGSFKIYSILP